MYDMIPTSLIQQVLAAQLPPKVEQLVFRLLTLTREHTVVLPKEQFIELAGATSWNRARTYLTAIRAAGLAHISTSDYLYFTWLRPDGQWYGSVDWAVQRSDVISNAEADEIIVDQADNQPVTHPRSETITVSEAAVITPDQPVDSAAALPRSTVISRYGNGAIRGDHAQPQPSKSVINEYGKEAINADQPAREAADQPSPVVRSFVRSSDPLPPGRTNERTNGSAWFDCAHQPSSPTNSRPKSEIECITALFCSSEVGLGVTDALRLAADHPLEWLERQVFAWLNERKRGVVGGSGALITRIRNRFSAPELTAEDKATPFYQRLHPNRQADEDRAQRSKYVLKP